MKKKVIVISVIAGIFIIGLCKKLIVGSRDVTVIENAAVEDSIVSDGINEQSGQERTEAEVPEEIQRESEKPEEIQPKSENPEEIESEETQAVQVSERQNKILHAEKVNITEPIAELNGEKGILNFGWTHYCYDCIRVDADTLLFASDCYFADEKLQQKIFFLAEAPDFKLREVFRQDSKIWDKELRWPECLECRMMRPYSVDGGYVYELDGVLYFMDGDFKEASPLCDLRELMGDYYSFSVGLYYGTCDMTEDASRMIACTDAGLYEYDLGNGNRKLIESAYYAPHDIDEEDCLCGQRDFRFAGPIKAEYGPDEQSYAFLTGTEESCWGDITGIVLRSGEGETIYQKQSDSESDYVYDFKWAESEDAIYLAVFYTDKYEKGLADAAWLMDRVNVNTGEVETFEVPKEIFSGAQMCCAVGFLDADTILYDSYNLQRFIVYRLSSGERQYIEDSEDVDWEMMVFDLCDFGTVPVRYPK